MKFRLIPKLTAVILTLILCIGCAGSVGYAEGEDKGQQALYRYQEQDKGRKSKIIYGDYRKRGCRI
jgi:hypothetical protein